MELRENMCVLIFYILIFNKFILIFFFIVHTASVLKFLFPTVYRFCLEGYIGSCFVVFFIYLFIYLFIYYFSTASTVILIFLVVVVITSVAFVVGHRCLLWVLGYCCC